VVEGNWLAKVRLDKAVNPSMHKMPKW